jgi:hypothetical protein
MKYEPVSGFATGIVQLLGLLSALEHDSGAGASPVTNIDRRWELVAAARKLLDSVLRLHEYAGARLKIGKRFGIERNDAVWESTTAKLLQLDVALFVHERNIENALRERGRDTPAPVIPDDPAGGPTPARLDFRPAPAGLALHALRGDARSARTPLSALRKHRARAVMHVLCADGTCSSGGPDARVFSVRPVDDRRRIAYGSRRRRARRVGRLRKRER